MWIHSHRSIRSNGPIVTQGSTFSTHDITPSAVADIWPTLQTDGSGKFNATPKTMSFC